MDGSERTRRRGVALLFLGPVGISVANLFGLRGTPQLALVITAIAIAAVGAAVVVVSGRSK
jgi:hypothetical protein